MFPVEVQLGPFTLNPHGAMAALGVLAGWLLARAEVTRKGLDVAFLDRLCYAALLGALIGARLHYVLFADLPGYLREPWSALRIWEGGIALQGGLIGGGVAGLWYCRRHGRRPALYADALVPGLLLGQALGRLGDFLVGGEYGTPTAVAWAVTFSDPRAQAPLGIPLHPTQLYEMGWDLGVLAALWPVRARLPYDGALFLGYAFLYSAGRLVIEYFRGDALTYPWFGRTLSVAMTISVLAMAGSAALHVASVTRRRRGLSSPPSAA